MRSSRFRVPAVVGIVAVSLLVSACTGSSDLQVQNPNVEVTADPNGDVPGVDNPVNEPGAPVEGEAASNLPNLVTTEQAPDPGKKAPDEYSDKELKSAFSWAAAFAQQRYWLSGYWADEINRPDRSPVVYYEFLPFLAPDTRAKWEGILVTAETMEPERKYLDSLVPYPFEIDGNWLAPAVADWAVGKPKYSTENGALVVEFPMSGYAAYVSKDQKTFYVRLVQEKAKYTLVRGPSKKEPWLLKSWGIDASVGEPEKLDSAPVDRIVPDYSWIPDPDATVEMKDPNAS